MNINLTDLLKNPNVITILSKLGEEFTKPTFTPENKETSKEFSDISDTIAYFKNLIGFGLFKNKETQKKYVISGVSTLLRPVTGINAGTTVVSFRDILTGQEYSTEIDSFNLIHVRLG